MWHNFNIKIVPFKSELIWGGNMPKKKQCLVLSYNFYLIYGIQTVLTASHFFCRMQTLHTSLNPRPRPPEIHILKRKHIYCIPDVRPGK